jgi:hypothetical protein
MLQVKLMLLHSMELVGRERSAHHTSRKRAPAASNFPACVS